jgi:DNA-binding NtrC family response regulator
MNMAKVNRKLPPLVTGSAGGPPRSDLDLMSAVRSDACVLLTGKEDAVRALAYRIHSLSWWRRGPFTVVDCALPGDNVERVLFGMFAESGLPGAGEPHAVPAQAGTVLLQNIGHLPPAAQVRVADRLMYLGERQPPGRPRCRLMASTTESLLPRVIDGTFDDRLFYRLNVIHMVIPDDRNTDETRRVRGVGGRYAIKYGVAHDTR